MVGSIQGLVRTGPTSGGTVAVLMCGVRMRTWPAGGPGGKPGGLQGSKHAGGSLAGMWRLIVGKCVYLDNAANKGSKTGRHQNNNSEAKCLTR